MMLTEQKPRRRRGTGYERRRSLIGDDPIRAQHVADVLKAVAHPMRVRLVAVLCQAPSNVTELTARLGVPQAIVSQQLRILRLHDLVAVERSGGFAVYRLQEPQLQALVRCMEGCEPR